MPNGPIPKDPNNGYLTRMVEYLVEEIRENRAEIRDLRSLLGDKVGRRELWGSIGGLVLVVGLAIRFLG